MIDRCQYLFCAVVSGCLPRPVIIALGLALGAGTLAAQEAEAYRQAPAAIASILDAPKPPSVSLSPGRDRLLLVESAAYPAVAELAEPMLGLAGYRINPQNNGPHRAPRYLGITIKTLANGAERKVALPGGARIGWPSWSPDGKQFAFARFTETKIELWVGNAETAKARRLSNVTLNAAYGQSFQWLPDSGSLLCQLVVARRGSPPAEPPVPAGPVVQESAGRKATIRTYQNLLRNPHDELLFDYYATSQLALVNARTGRSSLLGKPGVIRSGEPSPSGEFILVTRNVRPYSYWVPAASFPKEIEVWNRQGKLEYKLASLPLAEGVPPDGVQPGPRNVHWRPTEPATLVWVEALDKGDPETQAGERDRIRMLSAPFAAEPVELARLQQRFSSLTWGERDGICLLREYQSSVRRARTFLLRADQPAQSPVLLWDRSTQDRYSDPGTPLMRSLPNGKRVMQIHGHSIYLTGAGASAQGDRPFLDRFNLETSATERLFQCDEQSYESVIALLEADASQFITRYETQIEPPNYFVRSRSSAGRKPLTHFADPAPQLRGASKQRITYARPDGVQLSFTLYLPPDYVPGQRLPTVLWAYPREYLDADTAGQVAGSTHRFTTVSGASHLFLLTQGYAVLDGATMPVVGKSRTANDTYIEQIVASAKAAIDKAVELGVTDPERVAVAGHSYGAFMTANLLAHSDLFRAGIARSGAYNRTLTPFGFQNERRTLWQAPELYFKVSPFLAADKIKTPLLLIHGEADENSGTFPLQSERLYHAIKGTGGRARLVFLPHEGHSYQARESVEHALHEMVAWLDQHVKNAPPRAGSGSP